VQIRKSPWKPGRHQVAVGAAVEIGGEIEMTDAADLRNHRGFRVGCKPIAAGVDGFRAGVEERRGAAKTVAGDSIG